MADNAVAKAETTTLALPADLEGHQGHGTEGIGAQDVRPPRLVLAQSGSPQTKKIDEKYIPGLTEGDLFNDLTRAIYKRPLEFVVVKYLGKRAIEFYTEEERKQNGGQKVKDANVPLTDPRCQPTFDKAGDWVPPIADIFADYLVFLPATTEIVTLSFKNKDLSRNGAATQLNSLMKYILNLDGVVLTNPPAWARSFQLDTAGKTDGQHSWSVLLVKTIGVAPVETRKVAASLYSQFQDANIVVDAEQEPEAKPEPANVPF